ncbi:MAG: phosphoadenosine phosphosulfate reductase family protein, partial [Polyangiales bacterium]
MTDDDDFLALRASSSPFELLTRALSLFGDELRIACSLGVEDMVVVHEAARAGASLGVTPRVFLLDTGRLHQETYDQLDRVRDRYRVALDVFAPDTIAVQDLLRNKGPNSFYESVDNRRECCGVRKVEPLSRALKGARAWVTGLRRDQSPTRSDIA